ncbi:MAG: KpsF/GutQ family sugar-phosphate isomerase [Candidatus Paracaedibacteraceae bacterium]|nr:KpsF/GutQ family sugar-phosphate isomerase [Candidatus Paracaedibacteraceae bacterium]
MATSHSTIALFKESTDQHIAAAKSVLTNEADALHVLADQLDHHFSNVVNLLLTIKGRVIVTGIGKSGHVARKIAATFASTGQPAFFVHPAEANHGDMGMITPEDAVIALSNSGETAELSNLIDFTRRFNIPLVGITRNPESTLHKFSTHPLCIPRHPEACPMGLAPTTSTTMMLALGDALAVALLNARDFTACDFKTFHPGGSLGGKLRKVKECMHSHDKLPLVNQSDIMHEVLIVMSEKGFGCAGVLDDQGILVGVITDGDLRRHMGTDFLHQVAVDVMTSSPLTIAPDMLMTEALALMNHKRITSLFILVDNKPTGIIHVHDFLRAGIQ